MSAAQQQAAPEHSGDDGGSAAEAAARSGEADTRAPPAIPPLARLFLRQDYAAVDPQLPEMLQVLTEQGAGECWHKKSTFKAHLLEVYKIVKLWGADDTVARCALFHSAYSNSFVNLAIFKLQPEQRARVAQLIGKEAEELTHLFCVVPRQQLIQTQLLDKLPLGTADLAAPASITVPHIRTGEPLTIDCFTLGRFLLLTMADFAEQLFSWQDDMFGNTDGRLRLEGCPAPEPRFVWPGPMLPGLWMSAVSRMGRLLASCKQQLEAAGDERAALLPLPPVFDRCSRTLDEAQQAAARDAYWRAASDPALQGPHGAQQAAAELQRAVELNPWAAEPRLALAQLALHSQRWDAAAAEARRALDLLLDWGTAWDKRMPWDAWVAWARVCLEAALAREWPVREPLQVLSKGLVAGL